MILTSQVTDKPASFTVQRAVPYTRHHLPPVIEFALVAVGDSVALGEPEFLDQTRPESRSLCRFEKRFVTAAVTCQGVLRSLVECDTRWKCDTRWSGVGWSDAGWSDAGWSGAEGGEAMGGLSIPSDQSTVFALAVGVAFALVVLSAVGWIPRLSVSQRTRAKRRRA